MNALRAANDNIRLLSRREAAAYCGRTPSSFSDWVARGILPRALPGTRSWDRHAIDAAIDRLSGLDRTTTQDNETPLERWRRENGAGALAGAR